MHTNANNLGELVFFAALTSTSGDLNKDHDFNKYISVLEHILSQAPDLLEKKSSEGYSPLHAAVKINRPKTVKFLIAKGANQRTRDKEGRNILHSLLASDSWARSDVKDIKAILDLFDKESLKEMASERCSVHPGALTPLGLWMLRNQQSHKKDDVVRLLAEYSNGEELEMINGEGDLPLHVVSLNNFLYKPIH